MNMTDSDGKGRDVSVWATDTRTPLVPQWSNQTLCLVSLSCFLSGFWHVPPSLCVQPLAYLAFPVMASKGKVRGELCLLVPFCVSVLWKWKLNGSFFITYKIMCVILKNSHFSSLSAVWNTPSYTMHFTQNMENNTDSNDLPEKVFHTNGI